MLIGWHRCWPLLTLIGCCQDFNSSFLMAIAANLRGNPVMSETLMMMKMLIVVATLIIPIFGWRRL